MLTVCSDRTWPTASSWIGMDLIVASSVTTDSDGAACEATCSLRALVAMRQPSNTARHASPNPPRESEVDFLLTVFPGQRPWLVYGRPRGLPVRRLCQPSWMPVCGWLQMVPAPVFACARSPRPYRIQPACNFTAAIRAISPDIGHA